MSSFSILLELQYYSILLCSNPCVHTVGFGFWTKNNSTIVLVPYSSTPVPLVILAPALIMWLTAVEQDVGQDQKNKGNHRVCVLSNFDD